MDASKRAHARDLENPRDAGVLRDHEIEAASCLLRQTRGGCQHAHARRVEERTRPEVDHDPSVGRSGGQRLLETRNGGEVELAHHVHHDHTGGRRLGSYVKIARRGHGAGF